MSEDNYKVLIIDDNKAACNLIKTRLETKEYDVLIANNGTDGFAKADKEQPDLILLDIMMPGIDGFTVLKRLRSNANTATIPVVMLTAKGESDALINAANFRADDYVIKPFKFDDLLEIIRKYTED